VLALAGTTTQANEYPTQTVRIVVPFGAGGPNDLIGRPVAQKLTESLGQSFIIDNRPGANGIIGTNAVAKSEPDGYTMLLTTGSFTANPAIVAKLPYDPLVDFAPITQMTQSPGMLVTVPVASPIKSVADLVTAAKRDPGKLNYAMTGNGNITHVVIEFFKAVAGIDLVPVPYKGTADSITAMLSGQVQLSVVSSGSAAPYINNGQLRAIGITGKQRAPNLPDVPTFIEIGYPEMDFFGYHGLWFPAGTPRERVRLINQEVKKALRTPEVQRVIEDAGFAMIASSPEEFAAFLARDTAQQAAIIRRIGLQPK
jgi:tripartite-type tricarboxylate transporter receptor subunit TctC